MLHTKFRENRPAGSGEDFLKGFYHILAWRPSWSCDPRQMLRTKYCSPYPRRLHIKFGFDRTSGLGEEDL